MTIWRYFVFSSLCLYASVSQAAPTQYPFTIENCGHTLTFGSAPDSVVTVGQAATEILYGLGLGDKVKGTSVWTGQIQNEFREIDSSIERIADQQPSFEAVVGKRPSLVAVQWQYNVGPQGNVAPREQFHEIGVPTYVLPVDCVDKDNAAGADGIRLASLDTDNIFRGIRELAQIFDLQERGQQVIDELKRREARAVKLASEARIAGASALFWYSSSDKAADPFVAGSKGAPAYMLQRLGIRNVIESDEDWPIVGWETIARENPTFIVVASLARRKYVADDVQKKIEFLKTDPVTSQMDAVKANRIIVMDAHAMDPTMSTFDGLAIFAEAVDKAKLTSD